MMLAQSSQAGPVANGWLPNLANNLTATGSTQGTALAISVGKDLSILTTVAASTGVALPSAGVSPGEEYMIANHGANAVLVYPATGGKVSTGAANAGYSLAAGKTGHFTYVGQGQWTANP